MVRILVLPLVLLLGCAPAVSGPPAPAIPPPAPAEAPSAANAAERHREVHWFRTAAEYRALALQTYRQASERVRELAPQHPDGTWAVIVDADETLVDNSEFERRIAERGETFTEEAWDDWVREESAAAIPGAADFVALVQSLGGRVAVVTNRADYLCPATRRNLAALGMRPEILLCETETSQKEPRFERVARGTAAEGVPPLTVVLYVGDNIRDFPELDQDLRDAPRSAFEVFGDRYFILPNPMYGSWMGNPWR